MKNKITLVTYPDDVLFDAFRILTFDLTQDQSALVSYIANGNHSCEWTLDKKQKCSIIIINAESTDQTMVGYLAAQKNCYYIGNLRSVSSVNNRSIITIDDLKTIMEDKLTN
jgi:hypothetical protein